MNIFSKPGNAYDYQVLCNPARFRLAEIPSWKSILPTGQVARPALPRQDNHAQSDHFHYRYNSDQLFNYQTLSAEQECEIQLFRLR